MVKEIIFRISRPYKITRTTTVAKVVVPAVGGNFTVIPGRAPTLLLLTNGVVQLLDFNNKVLERYFIKGGVADIARDRCAVSAEKVTEFDEIDLEKAKAKKEEARHQEDKDYYQMITDYLNQNK